ncbi:MAG: glycosyltransferase family 2 protein [Clostridia bacterium]|nr:glycosyltransferase family 2 protein [Clostridia bacterium]
MNNQILVSVIIPTYRRSVSYVSRAVDSVLNQTYPNVEIIVVDDSTDEYEGRKDVEAYIDSLKKSNLIYCKNQKNLGGSLSRNRGIELSNGQYITFLDDDDEYLPEKIKKQLDFMLENSCDMSFSDMIMYSQEGKVVDCREYSDIPSFDNETLLRYHLMKHLTGTPTFMYKAEKLKEIGCFEDAKMGQEFYLMLKSIQNGLSIRYLPECDVRIYKHPDGGVSSGINKINGENTLYEFKKSFFDKLNKKEIRFIRFRHYAVMVVAYKRNRMPFRMLGSAITAFVSSPVDFMKEVSGFMIKVLKQRAKS